MIMDRLLGRRPKAPNLTKRYVGVRHKRGYGQAFIEEAGQRRSLSLVDGDGEIRWGPDSIPACTNLAVSILGDALGERAEALKEVAAGQPLVEELFIRRVINKLPPDHVGRKRGEDSWTLSLEDVTAWAEAAALKQRLPRVSHGDFVGSWDSSEEMLENIRINEDEARLESTMLRVETAMMRKIVADRPCRTCSGSGAVSECPTCRGKGTIYGSGPDGRPGGASCTTCGGTGRNLRESASCPSCSGTGLAE